MFIIVVDAAPTSTSATANIHSDGANAAATPMTPNTAAAIAMTANRTRSRRAARRAPATAPTAIADESSPNAVEPRPNSIVVMVEMKIGKLNPKVPTMNTIASTTTMSCRDRT